jgi:hypothetical protein
MTPAPRPSKKSSQGSWFSLPLLPRFRSITEAASRLKLSRPMPKQQLPWDATERRMPWNSLLFALVGGFYLIVYGIEPNIILVGFMGRDYYCNHHSGACCC